ncbi:tetratricopeptide repeat-containing sensor histidine kinase [Spirosoma flavum]|uniref:histidine kinase n=1 Tax=Spirosoma flavum TaxID=2048557 RepID=A0ABW6AR19_9BACT
MNTRFILVISILLSNLVFAENPKVAPEYDQFKASISGLADTTQVRKLCDFASETLGKADFIRTQQVLDDALVIAQTSKDRESLRKVFRLLGNLKFAENKFPEAITVYHKALTFSQPAQRFAVFINIGIIYMNALDYNRAEGYFNQVLQAQAPAASLKEIAFANLNMGGVADQRHLAKEAVVYYQKAMTMYKELKLWNNYYAAVLNSAISYSDLKQYTKSVALFKTCLQYADRIENQPGSNEHSSLSFRTHAYVNLPYPLIALKRFDEAEKYTMLALQYARQDAGKITHLMWIYDAMTLLYEKKGDYEKALEAHRQWATYRDSTQNQARTQKFAELETRYQTKEQVAKIKLLDEANALKNRQLWAGVSGLFVLSLLLGTTVWQNRRIQRSRAKIQQQSNQLSLMMKELHHRVKNNLAIVSSLLRLQSSRLDDEKAVQAVRTGQQRVEAMSLIHQRLYQTDQITTVNIREYLTDLAESLMQAYDYDPSDFDLIIDVENQELDVDVAMPLGLIANELITNAFKYAYTNGQRPLLRIELQTQNGLTLEVQDNGPGIDLARWQERSSRDSFGKRLIASLSEQLEGEVELQQQNGALFRLRIPKTRLRTVA